MTNVLIVRKAQPAENLIKYMFAVIFGQCGAVQGISVLVCSQIFHEVATLHQLKHQHDVVDALHVLVQADNIRVLQCR